MTTGMGRPCGRYDPELWFAEKPELLARAQAICAGCPARASCLDDALSRREPWGVWGGEIVLRGRVIAQSVAVAGHATTYRPRHDPHRPNRCRRRTTRGRASHR